MRKLFVLPVLALLPALAVAGVYKWVDDNGTVHYSDTPQPGSEEVHVPPPQTYSPAPLPSFTPTPEPQDAPAQYSRLDMTAPAQDANIWENTGSIAVSFVMEPPLKTARGHQLQVLVDGEVRSTAKGSDVTIENIERGSHSLQGRIVDAAGEVLISSTAVTVHVHRQSVLLPNRARPQPR